MTRLSIAIKTPQNFEANQNNNNNNHNNSSNIILDHLCLFYL